MKEAYSITMRMSYDCHFHGPFTENPFKRKYNSNLGKLVVLNNIRRKIFILLRIGFHIIFQLNIR